MGEKCERLARTVLNEKNIHIAPRCLGTHYACRFVYYACKGTKIFANKFLYPEKITNRHEKGKSVIQNELKYAAIEVSNQWIIGIPL